MLELKNKVLIAEDDVREFFDKKAQNDSNAPLSTMLQKNPDISYQRDIAEKELMIAEPLIVQASRVLDLGCGNGRLCSIFSDLIQYNGVDLSVTLIEQARNSYLENKFSFHVSSVKDIKKNLTICALKYDLVIISGLLIYLNDHDLPVLFENIEALCDKNCVIYIREPVSLLNNKFVLKNHYSEELNSVYNAIYRTEEEMKKYFITLINKGFVLYKSDFMYKNNFLNNRRETIQKYFVLKR